MKIGLYSRISTAHELLISRAPLKSRRYKGAGHLILEIVCKQNYTLFLRLSRISPRLFENLSWSLTFAVRFCMFANIPNAFSASSFFLPSSLPSTARNSSISSLPPPHLQIAPTNRVCRMPEKTMLLLRLSVIPAGLKNYGCGSLSVSLRYERTLPVVIRTSRVKGVAVRILSLLRTLGGCYRGCVFVMISWRYG